MGQLCENDRHQYRKHYPGGPAGNPLFTHQLSCCLKCPRPYRAPPFSPRGAQKPRPLLIIRTDQSYGVCRRLLPLLDSKTNHMTTVSRTRRAKQFCALSDQHSSTRRFNYLQYQYFTYFAIPSICIDIV